MRLRSTFIRAAAAFSLAALPVAVLAAPASAKGTPSNVTVTCSAAVQSATITIQLMSGLTNPTPASNQVVFNCTPYQRKTSNSIAPLSQPAAAYSWSAYVTGTGATFGCGGTALRGTTVTCTNTALGGSPAQGQVTILAT